MTITEALQSDKILLNTSEAGSLLQMHPQEINRQVKAGEFPIECIRSGNRVKIPRLKLLKFLGFNV